MENNMDSNTGNDKNIRKSTRNELMIFFFIAFGWMWLINLPRLLSTYGNLSLSPFLSTILGYVAVFGPMVAALILTGVRSGKQGLKSLWKSAWHTKFPKKWLIPTVLLFPVKLVGYPSLGGRQLL